MKTMRWVTAAIFGFVAGWVVAELTRPPATLLMLVPSEDGDLHYLSPEDLAGMEDEEDDDEPGAGWLRDMWGQ